MVFGFVYMFNTFQFISRLVSIVSDINNDIGRTAVDLPSRVVHKTTCITSLRESRSFTYCDPRYYYCECVEYFFVYDWPRTICSCYESQVNAGKQRHELQTLTVALMLRDFIGSVLCTPLPLRSVAMNSNTASIRCVSQQELFRSARAECRQRGRSPGN